MLVALVHEVFHDTDGAARLTERLGRAAGAGAQLAVLPELPLNPWSPATPTVRDDDAEGPDGPRARTMAEAARSAGIGLIGGVIRRDAAGRRRNRVLVFDATGGETGGYDKLHLPSEDGFWESDHFEPGDEPPRPIRGFGLPIGIQICSDLNRSQGSQLLAAQGVAAIVAPRATPRESYERWKLVIRSIAVTCAVYVLSTNRPGPEPGVEIGGPTLAVGPDGGVLLESTDPIGLVTLDPSAVEAARREYPGYLAVRPRLYARGWSELTGGD